MEFCLFVRDTGVGIPDDSVTRVFNRFEQVDNRLSTTTAGTGLGLAITQNLVEKMGGRIHIDSQLGKGTTFTVQLPLRCDDQSHLASLSGVQPPPPPKAIRAAS